MYHYVYKTENKINGKFYLGMHSSETPTDSYLGSSRYLKKDIKKFGRINFEVVDRVYFKNRDEAREFEALCVSEALELYKDKMYNRAKSGCGGVEGEGNSFYGREHTKELKLKLSKIASKRVGKKNAFYGKTHSDELKEKFSRDRKGINAKVCNNQARKSITKSTGWWCTPFGCFVSDRYASEVTGLGRGAIRSWCKNPDENAGNNYQIPSEYHNKTWKENGFYFISKEEQAGE